LLNDRLTFARLRLVTFAPGRTAPAERQAQWLRRADAKCHRSVRFEADVAESLSNRQYWCAVKPLVENSYTLLAKRNSTRNMPLNSKFLSFSAHFLRICT